MYTSNAIVFFSTLPSIIAQLTTSTCSRTSAAACPTSSSPCCAYLCAEAQVPFDVCSPDDETGDFASCQACPTSLTTPTATTIATNASTSISSTTIPATTITAPVNATIPTSTSTCTGAIASVGCPVVYDSCCAWVCEEAQVPFKLCAGTDMTGEFETCQACPGPPATST